MTADQHAKTELLRRKRDVEEDLQEDLATVRVQVILWTVVFEKCIY